MKMVRWLVMLACMAVDSGASATPAGVVDTLSGSGSSAPWERLDPWQGQFSRAVLEDRLNTIYAAHADWTDWILLTDDAAWVRTSEARPHRYYRLTLRSESNGAEGDASSSLLSKPLTEWTIAIDPGHIGGEWGRMEQRSFAIGDGPVVQEGDLVLAAARRLAALLRDRGAQVVLVREEAVPVSSRRPADFLEQAERELASVSAAGGVDEDAVRRRSEQLFYRDNEIRARVAKVNAAIRPDLVIALHLNAAPWPEGDALRLVDRNDGHIIVTGGFMTSELRRDDVRFALLWRLLQGFDRTEVALAKSVAAAMAERTNLPPTRYQGRNAVRVGESDYVWARNLLANRTYDAPVIYLEPWILNSREVYPWAAHGDYDGEIEVDGERRLSLPKVYADFVLEGILRAMQPQDGAQDAP